MAENTVIEQGRVFAEEAAVVNAQTLLHSIMEEKGISRADLARAMNVSRARVSQIFSDDCSNFTIRLLARALCALEEDLVMLTDSQMQDIREKSRIEAMAVLALGDHELGRWTLIEDYAPIPEFGTANDNIFGGLAVMRDNRDEYEEMAA